MDFRGAAVLERPDEESSTRGVAFAQDDVIDMVIARADDTLVLVTFERTRA